MERKKNKSNNKKKLASKKIKLNVKKDKEIDDYSCNKLIKFIKNKKFIFKSEFDYKGSLKFLNTQNKALEYIYLDDYISDDENIADNKNKLQEDKNI